MPPLRFASWAAVSSLPQAKKISNEDQLRLNREHIARHGGQLVAELVVPGESRSIILFEDAARRIDAYAELKRLIDAKAFDVLIYLDRSRLGRKAPLSMAVVELCHEAGIITYETENPPATLDKPNLSHDDQLLGAIKSVGAQREIDDLKRRHRMGMIGRVQRGEVPGKIVYGYKAQYAADGTRQIVIDEDAAAAVRQMFAWYLAGDGAPAIAEKLNALGVATMMGGTWIAASIRRMLDNAARYAGYTEVNRISPDRPYVRARGNWQPIIDDVTLEAVRAEKRARMAHRHIPNTPYHLSGVVWCQPCLRLMIMRTQESKRRDGSRLMRMVCLGDHDHKAIPYHRVMTELRQRMASLNEADLDQVAEDDGQLRLLEGQMEQHRAVIVKIEAAMLRADDAYVAGTMDADRYARQVEKLKAQIANSQTEISRLEMMVTQERERGTRRQRLQETMTVGLAMLDSADATAANAWLRNHVRVWVANHEVVAVEWI